MSHPKYTLSQQQVELSLSFVSRRKANRCQYYSMQKQQRRISRRAAIITLFLLLVSIWTQQKLDHRSQRCMHVVAFTVFVNHKRIAVAKTSAKIVSFQQQNQRQEFNARRRDGFVTVLSRIVASKSATQLAVYQEENQNEKEDASPMFYNDFDGFNSEDIYMTNEKGKMKAKNRAMNVDETDDDDENDSIINEDALGDWRSFRRKLASQERQQRTSLGPTSLSSSSSSYTVFDNSNRTESGMGLNNNSIYSTTNTGTVDDSIEQEEQQRHNPSLISSAIDNKKGTTMTTTKKSKSANEILFEQQNDKLAQEYYQDTWAHEIATPEIGGLMIRMPLEVEIRRNYKHSKTGQKLRQRLQQRIIRDNMNSISKVNTKKKRSDDKTQKSKPKQFTAAPNDSRTSDNGNTNDHLVTVDNVEMAIWYSTAQSLVEEEMKVIAGAAESNGELDSNLLTDDSNEVLQLYLDHQETWQEVCLVTSYDKETATTLVLNRPLALQLTDSLGKLVLYGAFSGTKISSSGTNKKGGNDDVSIKNFIKAFGRECGVYVGGPDDQHLPAILIHGIGELDGAEEIAPGTGIYQGGLSAAVQGVLAGKYKPLEFRFFVGRHSYSSELEDELYDEEDDDDVDDDDEGEDFQDDDEMIIASTLDLDVVLGKYQPVACARSIALKQCIQLPKPLWHEVLELCGGELKDISEFEQLKRDDIPFQFVSEDDDGDDDDDDDDEFEIIGLTDEDDIEALLNGDDEEDESDDDNEDSMTSEYYKI